MNWFSEQWFNVCNMARVLWKREPKHELSYAWHELWWNFIYPVWRAYKQMGVIISYLPVLWKDRDWDHAYFLSLMQHKLKRMEKAFRNGRHVGCEKDAAKMKQCVDLIDRILNNDYMEPEYTEHNKKWGNINCMGPIHHENANTPEEEKQCNAELLSIADLEDRRMNRDYKLLFYIIRRNLRRWWD